MNYLLVYNLSNLLSFSDVTTLLCEISFVMNTVDLTPTEGTFVDGINESLAPRSVDNIIEQPATVTLPTPVAMNKMGHGTLHGDSLTTFRDSLAEFLSRPVQIGTIATTVGSLSTMSPWSLFLANPLVAEKIKAFGFIRGTLNIRFVMSVSQFCQGRVYVAYNPGGTTDDLIYDRRSTTLTMSHLPFAGYMDPGIANDMEWSIPYHQAIPFTPVENANVMGGTLHSRVAVPFENANTGTPTGTLIKVLAWMTDVQLVVAAVPQSANVSATSRALQMATNGLSAVKAMVGATAPSQFAHAVGDALASFGYTREVDVRDHQPSRLRSTAAWAITEGADASYPLTADPLAEKSMSTDTIIGMTQDELLITYMAGRYSYAEPVSWNSTSETLLWQEYVHPNCWDGTCVDAVTQPFSYWRGSLKYKFSAIRTPFHKGKLLVKWSPGAMADDMSLNTGYSVIWDLDSTPEIEVVVPYNRPDYWAKTQGYNYAAITAGNANGYISLYVMETLTGPVDVVDVPIHVFIAGGGDYAVTCPTFDNLRTLTFGKNEVTGFYNPLTVVRPFPSKGQVINERDPILPQSGEEDRTLSRNVFHLGPMSHSDDAALSSMSEQIISFRELLKRKAYATTCNTGFDFIPVYPKSPAGIYVWTSSTTTALQESPHGATLMAYLMAMFLGVRGSTKWDYALASGIVHAAAVTRSFGHKGVVYGLGDPSQNLLIASMNGTAFIRSDLDGALSYVCPHYIRGSYTQCATYLQDPYIVGTNYENNDVKDNGVFVFNNNTTQGGLAYVSAGDDFNLLYFLGPPPYQEILIPPPG